MKPLDISTRFELARTTRLAEQLYKVIIDKDIKDDTINHHVRNSVTAMRGISLTEDTEEEILTLCTMTRERLLPYLYLLKHLFPKT